MLELFYIDHEIIMQFAFYFLVALNVLVLSFFLVLKKKYKIGYLILGNVAFLLQHIFILLDIYTVVNFSSLVNIVEITAIILYIISLLSLYNIEINYKKYWLYWFVSTIGIMAITIGFNTISYLRAFSALIIVVMVIELLFYVNKKRVLTDSHFHLFINLNLTLYLLLKLALIFVRIYSSTVETSIESIQVSIVTFTFVTIIFIIWFNLSILFLTYEKLYLSFKNMSYTDTLTGVFNRRYAFMKLEEYYELYVRKKLNFAVILLDIDGFKSVNDKYGHKVGDVLLREFSRFMEDVLRKVDTFARYGGDEFLAIVNVDHYEESQELMFRILEKLEETTFTSDNIKITVSGGVVILNNDNTVDSVDQIIDIIDERLYKAKKQEGNVIK